MHPAIAAVTPSVVYDRIAALSNAQFERRSERFSGSLHVHCTHCRAESTVARAAGILRASGRVHSKSLRNQWKRLTKL